MAFTPTSPGQNSFSAERLLTGPELILVDQTLLSFDLDQGQNLHTLNIRKIVPGKVAFRWLTNAPTRYVVYPNRGILCDDAFVPVTIELLHNKYSPLHKIKIQALLVRDNIAGDPFADRSRSPEDIQNVSLHLGTTVMNLDHADYLSKQGNADSAGSKESESLVSILDSESQADKTASLRELRTLLAADLKQIQKNTDSTIHLENVLRQQLQLRQDTLKDTRTKREEAQASLASITTELATAEAELRKIHGGEKPPAAGGKAQGFCSIM